MAKSKPSKGMHKVQGNAGLSLEKFAKAKRTTYDKRAAAEQVHKLRAQRLSKYKRLKSKLAKIGQLAPPQVLDRQPSPQRAVRRPELGDRDQELRAAEASPASAQERRTDAAPADQGTQGASSQNGRKKRGKRRPQIELLAARVQLGKDKQEAEKQRVRQEAEARQQRTAEGLSKRKKLRGQFFKKTKSGQPVMKHRIANLLTKL